MLKLALVYLLTTAYSDSNVKCNTYECTTFTQQSQCYAKQQIGDRFNFQLHSCPQDQLCDFYNDFGQGSCKEHVPTKLPGEFCKSPADCSSNICLNHTCQGVEEKGSCVQDEQCNHGLFCKKKNGECAPVIGVNKECTKNDRCDAGLVCNGVCVPLFSIPKGNNSDFGPACETFYAEDGVCTEGPKLKGENAGEGPTQCNTLCTYTTPKDSSELPCVCGMTSEETKYCNPGIGDINLDDVLCSIKF
eukprot:TRINITY_DN8762_c0_g1_i1.p1 TRINITY_DN8762_c0_g1~~TRINITY_DN8762_c0_g1_i1.p1  ORF type:complete len:246 (-),score=44.93 TRINITY_DN8762_c0_g1_i1:206-943(-)